MNTASNAIAMLAAIAKHIALHAIPIREGTRPGLLLNDEGNLVVSFCVNRDGAPWFPAYELDAHDLGRPAEDVAAEIVRMFAEQKGPS